MSKPGNFKVFFALIAIVGFVPAFGYAACVGQGDVPCEAQQGASTASGSGAVAGAAAASVEQIQTEREFDGQKASISEQDQGQVIENANTMLKNCQDNMGSAQSWEPAKNLRKYCQGVVDRHVEREINRRAYRQFRQQMLAKLMQEGIKAGTTQLGSAGSAADVNGTAAQYTDEFSKITTMSSSELRKEAAKLQELNTEFKERLSRSFEHVIDPEDGQLQADSIRFSENIDAAVKDFNQRANALDAEAMKTTQASSNFSLNANQATQLAGALSNLGGKGGNNSSGSSISSGNSLGFGGSMGSSGAASSKGAAAGGGDAWKWGGDETNSLGSYGGAGSSLGGSLASSSGPEGDQKLTAKERAEKALAEKRARASRGLASVESSGTSSSGEKIDAKALDGTTAVGESGTGSGGGSGSMGSDLGLAASLGADGMSISDMLGDMLGLGNQEKPEEALLGGDRALAAENSVTRRLPQGVLSSDSATLFERIKKANARSIKRGTLMNGLNSKI